MNFVKLSLHEVMALWFQRVHAYRKQGYPVQVRGASLE